MSKRTQRAESISGKSVNILYPRWVSKTGQFALYDKNSNVEIPMPLPVKVAYLTSSIKITGYDETEETGINSNEITNLKDETLRVVANTVIADGYYDQIKDEVKSRGGKYTQIVYAVDHDTKEIVKLQFSGSSLSAWINATKDLTPVDLAKKSISFTDAKENSFTNKNDEVITYFTPIIDFEDANENEMQLADDAYESIEHFFNKKAPKKESIPEQADNADDDLPF